MKLTRRPAAVLPALATMLALTVGAVPAGAVEDPPPSVRLVSSTGQVTLYRYGKDVPLDVGVYVAAEGDFQLRVARPDYDSPVEIAQVDAETGEVLRSLPAHLLDGWAGVTEFVRVIFRDASGQVVRSRRFTFCPNAWDRQRVDDQGPAVSRYPGSCSVYFPFAKGTVWGIDHHWASPALAPRESFFEEFGPFFDYGFPSVRLPEGDYTLTVRIPRAWAELLGASVADTKLTLQATVEAAEERREDFFFSDASERRSPEEGVPTVTDPDPDTLPDLLALPPWGIQMFSRRGRDFLSFAATPWNGGPRALVVEGFRRPGEDAMDAYQYFHDADGNTVGRAPVGTFEYDSRRGHQHWHFLQFAAFQVLDASNQEVVRSGKQAFCIVPTDAVDLSVRGADWSGGGGLWTRCGGERSIWVREVLPAGWGDTYYQGIPGQSFDVTDLPNGWYSVQVQVNPTGELYDADPSNDAESRLVRLKGRPGRRAVEVMPWHGIYE